MNTQAACDEPAFLCAVRNTPIIDNHAHPLLRSSVADTLPLLSITTEAEGNALKDTISSLSHIRAVKQLSEALGCEPTWSCVSTAIHEKRKDIHQYESWVRTCLSGVHCVLVDDLIGVENDNEKYSYFDKFTPAKSKRIIRIEHLAAKLIEETCSANSVDTKAFSSFVQKLKQSVSQCILDPEVVGFKSVICYRTGLGIPQHPDEDKAFSVFRDLHQQRQQPGAKGFSRLDHDGLNDFVVHCLATIIAESNTRHPKPIQFHTGLGDNDITLTRASPAHLQHFIKQYPTVPIVLLHSGYPFVRDGGYLATVYANVYLDIGEVFPMISRDGEEKIVRQTLELCPSSKVLWSTDGHWFPETYLLAVIQMREAFETVLSEYVRRGDLTWYDAKTAFEDIVFNNSNKLYHLELLMEVSLPLSMTQVGILPSKRKLEILQDLINLDNSLQFIRICWQDMTGMTRAKSIPIRRALSLLQSGKTLAVSISEAALAVLQTDQMPAGASPVGEWNLCADFSSLRLGPRKGQAMMMGDFKGKDGASVSICPRTLLQKILERAASHGLEFLMGFEIEFVLLRQSDDGAWVPLDGSSHAWCTAGALDHPAAIDVVEEAIARLDKAGIYVETMHAESAVGQYEIVLPPSSPLDAIDTLIYARQVLSICAMEHGYKITLHPKPFANTAGTAAHVHMSISSPGGADPTVYEPFYAGVLHHLPSIIAYACANPVSYDRLVDSCWAGGTWVTWGIQNRETPLRKVEDSHWEFKCMDGLANPYLAVASILASGLDGIFHGRKMQWKECLEDPASLTPAQRETLNITTKLPSTLEHALDVLKKDSTLKELLGQETVDWYIVVKEAELELLASVNEFDRRQWIIGRY